MSRGVPLPRRGSPRDMVLRGLLEREQAARLTEIGMVARFLGLVAGVDTKNVNVALELYTNELTQVRYGPRGRELTDKILEKLPKPTTETADELKERLKKVAALNSSS